MSSICNTVSFPKSDREMSMDATGQREQQVSSVSLDLNPPVRAESIDLRVLVGHRTATAANASVESVAEIFKSGTVNFIAVLEGQRLLGMCSRQETAALLGGRYGFSLWARKPIRDHLCKQETRIKMATELQQALMPSTYPTFPADAAAGDTRLRFCHRYLPATQMGGDFFHIARLTDDTAAICICDVMGHGVRAALITAMMRAMIETHAIEAPDPGRLLTQLNSEFTGILKQTGTLVFVTVLYCVINVREGIARFARAGHPPPLQVRRSSGEVQTVVMGADSAGPAIGIIPNAHFKTTEAKLAPGDCLLFYTDGIIEVEARDGSQFGIEGLRESVRSNLNQPTESLLDAIVSDVCKFGDSTVLTDDACLVTAEL